MGRRRLRTRTRERLIRAGLVALVFSAPVVTAATLLKAASGTGQMQLAAPSAAESAVGTPPNVVPLVAGVLYTNGPVKVNWNGVNIDVKNSSYAYTGGETVNTAPNAMGILRLTGGNTVFICPGSKVRLSRDKAGGFSLDIAEGSSRFMFDTKTPFQVKVNDTVLTPESAVPPPGDSAEEPMYVGEAQAQKDGGALLSSLKNNLRVNAEGTGEGAKTVSAIEGEIVTVPGPGKKGTTKTTTGAAPAQGSARDGGGRTVSKIKIPEKVFSTMAVTVSPANGKAKGIGYLCKLQQLKEYADNLALLLAKQQEQDAQTTDNGTSELAATEFEDGSQPEQVADSGTAAEPPEPDPAPPVAPPDIPGLVVADAGAPDPFVPGLSPAAGGPGDAGGPSPGDSPIVLAPPGAPGGGGSAGGGVPIVLPPPLVPGGGSGGGPVVSPS